MNLVEARKRVEAAEAALNKARASLDGERGRIQKARDELAALDAKILTIDPADTRQLVKADAERIGLRCGVEVLTLARLPRAESAVQEAAAVLAEAQADHDALAKAAELERLTAEAARLEADLLQRSRAFRGELEPVLRRLDEARRAGRDLALEQGASWAEGLRWPDGDDSDEVLFRTLGLALTPPAGPTLQDEGRERERVAQRAREDAWARSLLDADAAEKARAARRPQSAGLTEREPAVLREPSEPRPLGERTWNGRGRP